MEIPSSTRTVLRIEDQGDAKIRRTLAGSSRECDNGDPRMETRVASRLMVAFLLAALAPSLPGQSSHQSHATRPAQYGFKVVRTFSHDPMAFTQGIVYRDGFLYEGTGLK